MAKQRKRLNRTFSCCYCGARITSDLSEVFYVGKPPRERKIVPCLACGSENVWHEGRDSLDPWRASRRIAEKNQDDQLRHLAKFIRDSLAQEANHRGVDSDFAREATA